MGKASLSDFLAQVDVIYNLHPAYETGHDGSDGYCDCIGLIKGALRRCGVSPTGLSGTNYAARHTIVGLTKFSSTSQLSVGDVVLKVRDMDDPSMPLPDKYRPGGTDYTGDLTNYTHIGVVDSVNPLRIKHMTSPTTQTDTKIGKWCYKGTLPHIKYDGGDEPVPTPDPEPEYPEIAVVYAENGKPVNMRQGKDIKSKLVCKVPCGDTVDVMQKGSEWSKVQYMEGSQLRKGYMMSSFLIFEGEPMPNSDDPDHPYDPVDGDDGGSDTVTLTLSRSKAEAILEALEDCAQVIASVIGRG